MSIRLSSALSLHYEPLALYYAQEDPPAAKKFKKEKTTEGGWGCAMFLLNQALSGQTVSFSRETGHCPGAAAGMGLAVSRYEDFPGGSKAFCYFLSSGNENWEEGRIAGQKLIEGGAGQEMIEDYLKGEGFKKTPELVLDYMAHIPHITPKGRFVILEPLSKALPEIVPEVVVRTPFGSGCQSIGMLPIFEATQKNPKAIIGLTDISARLYLRKLLGKSLLSFSVPWSLYQEMEANVEESFLSRQAWKKLQE